MTFFVLVLILSWVYMFVILWFGGKYWHPQKGRQQATENLTKIQLWELFGTDGYILWFPEGYSVGEHVDVVENKEHHRLNLTLFGVWILELENYLGYLSHIQEFLSYHKFRPDIQKHKAFFCKNCLVLSIGWTNPIKYDPPTS